MDDGVIREVERDTYVAYVFGGKGQTSEERFVP